MFPQSINVSVIQQMRFVSEFPSKRKARLFRDRKRRPFTVQCRDLIFLHTCGKEFGFLVSQAVLTVVRARNNPEQLYLEWITQRHIGIVVATSTKPSTTTRGPTCGRSRGTSPRSASHIGCGKIVISQSGFIASRPFPQFLFVCLGQFRKRNPGRPRLHVLEILLHLRTSQRDRPRGGFGVNTVSDS